MNTNHENDASEYIRLRIRRALELKAMREVLADIEVEEATDRKILRRLGITLVVSIILTISFVVQNLLEPAPPPTGIQYVVPQYWVFETAGKITSWDAKKATASITLITGEKIKCAVGLPVAKEGCTITVFINAQELGAGIAVSILKYYPDSTIKKPRFIVNSIISKPRHTPIR